MDTTDLPKKKKYITTSELTHSYVAKNEVNIIDHALRKEKHKIKVIYPTEEELACFPPHVQESMKAYIALETMKLKEMV